MPPAGHLDGESTATSPEKTEFFWEGATAASGVGFVCGEPATVGGRFSGFGSLGSGDISHDAICRCTK